MATYSLHLTGIRSQGEPPPGESIDLMYGLGGVEAAWDAGGQGPEPAWSGWWPDLDPGIVRRLTLGSLTHQRSLALLSRPGQLVLRTLVVLSAGETTLRFVSNVAIAASIGGEKAVGRRPARRGAKGRVPRQFHRRADRPGRDAPDRRRPEADDLPGELFQGERTRRTSAWPHERLLVPWATTNPPLPADRPTLPAGMAGGDPVKGEAVFFGAQAKCSACHAFAGKGGNVGPELGHQFERPPAEVYRDIADPGIWINPNYVAYTWPSRMAASWSGSSGPRGPTPSA